METMDTPPFNQTDLAELLWTIADIDEEEWDEILCFFLSEAWPSELCQNG